MKLRLMELVRLAYPLLLFTIKSNTSVSVITIQRRWESGACTS
ncbi:hypothetical protein L914_13910 [Phytophthora nicotianae]|uniref:Uncharacterized protein n=1 Tax=Phytophthora nicotianae TaxID=4792 RepID=W2MX30_PHYNI|nr:hypothetical protein L914_13910 [Phytophthora nicotianae]